MNLIELYTNEIKKKIIKNKALFNIKNSNDIKNIIVEIPPDKFNFDLSSNAAMILAKKSNDNPKEVANKLKDILQKEITDFSIIEIAGPGFLNFKISDNIWIKTIKSIFKARKNFNVWSKKSRFCLFRAFYNDNKFSGNKI